MKKAQNKYNGSIQHKYAIMHMVGQSQEVFKGNPTTADIAAWMGVSKTTARKHLNNLADDYHLVKITEPYKNTYKHTWKLSEVTLYLYHRNELKPYYEIYAQRIMGVTLQD